MNFLASCPALFFLIAPWLLAGLVLAGPFLALLTVIAAASVLPLLVVASYVLIER